MINGSYWLGAAVGALGALLLLDTASSPPTSAGGWRSASAPCSASASCSCAATCPRARAGCSSTAARRRPSGSSARSRRRCDEETGEELEEPERAITIRQREHGLVPRDRPRPCSALPAAHRARPRAVRRPGVPLQRRHLHLGTILARSSASTPARARSTSRCSRSATSSARCCSGGCSTRSGASR